MARRERERERPLTSLQARELPAVPVTTRNQTATDSGHYDEASHHEGADGPEEEGDTNNQLDCQATAAEPDGADAETVPWYPRRRSGTQLLGDHQQEQQN